MGTYYPDHELLHSDMDVFFSSCCKLSAFTNNKVHQQFLSYWRFQLHAEKGIFSPFGLNCNSPGNTFLGINFFFCYQTCLEAAVNIFQASFQIHWNQHVKAYLLGLRSLKVSIHFKTSQIIVRHKIVQSLQLWPGAHSCQAVDRFLLMFSLKYIVLNKKVSSWSLICKLKNSWGLYISHIN